MKKKQKSKKPSSVKKDKSIAYFKKCVNHWIDLFALKSFEIGFDKSNTISARAYCSFHDLDDIYAGARMFTIVYSEDWITNAPDEEICAVAFHEVMEALLYKMHMFGNNRSVMITEKEVDDSVHAVIRTLENCVMKYLPKIERKK
jgi:hypothetical protein